nr:reverse transcriptase domain-containing protein [Tanacetum cinerariifolium]
MEEMLAKFIDEGKCKDEEMEIFIKEFKTTNELLLKQQSNLLSELKIKINKLSKVMSNILIPKYKVNGVISRGGKMTSESAPSKEINETRINKNEPPIFERMCRKSRMIKFVLPNWTFEKRKRYFSQVKTYFWEEPYAFKLCADNKMRRRVAGNETLEILAHCHSRPTGGRHSANVTVKKFYKTGFYWPSVFKDANEYVRRCDAC